MQIDNCDDVTPLSSMSNEEDLALFASIVFKKLDEIIKSINELKRVTDETNKKLKGFLDG